MVRGDPLNRRKYVRNSLQNVLGVMTCPTIQSRTKERKKLT